MAPDENGAGYPLCIKNQIPDTRVLIYQKYSVKGENKVNYVTDKTILIYGMIEYWLSLMVYMFKYVIF